MATPKAGRETDCLRHVAPHAACRARAGFRGGESGGIAFAWAERWLPLKRGTAARMIEDAPSTPRRALRDQATG